jgi:RNA polymerase subunit RPABC4/transcription elongation factor Spt4
MRCKDCGATVEPSDRFCPACGTPNAFTRFHPKFGPEPVRFEPEIIFDVAPAGSPSCPRCDRVIRADERYCQGCGMDLAAVWGRYRQERVVAEWQAGDHHLRAYRPAGALGAAARAMLALAGGAAALVGVGELWFHLRLQGLFRFGPATADLEGGLARIEPGTVALALIALVLHVAWSSRAARNLPALGVLDRRYGPVWAVLGWVVPGWNLIRPKQVLDDLWRAGEPGLPPYTPAWRRVAPPLLSSLWWTGLLFGTAFTLGAALLGVGQPADPAALPVSGPAGPAPVFDTGSLFAAVAGLALGAALVAGQVLVGRVSDRHDGRAAATVLPEITGAPPAARLEALLPPPPAEAGPAGRPVAGRTSALRVQPSGRKPVWGKY